MRQPAQPVDRVWRHARLATFVGEGIGVVDEGVVATVDGLIAYAGSAAAAPAFDAHETVDCERRWITPGLIDCHTHLVHAGDRSEEFALRLAGVSYDAIAERGGGILSTVRATRQASDAALLAGAVARADRLIAEGVTTIEVKSGYGLDAGSECRMLSAARQIGAVRPVRIVTSFLGAHALPPERQGDQDGFVDEICAVMLPTVARLGLADAVDAFCETIAFSPRQVARVFDTARTLGLPVKLHADQRSDSGGAALAARYRALSADHLEYTSEPGVAALAAAGSTAVLLPGAFYTLRETRTPPVDALRRHGVPIAVATDCNPGTSPLTSILLAMNMAATLFRLTVDECLAGVTREAARALRLDSAVGTLERGKACDLAIWDVDHPRELVHHLGANPLHTRVWGGRATA